MEPDLRYYRRRANEEIAAANRAVTAAARERRMQLADLFLMRLRAVEGQRPVVEPPILAIVAAADDPTVFDWAEPERISA